MRKSPFSESHIAAILKKHAQEGYIQVKEEMRTFSWTGLMPPPTFTGGIRWALAAKGNLNAFLVVTLNAFVKPVDELLQALKGSENSGGPLSRVSVHLPMAKIWWIIIIRVIGLNPRPSLV